MADPRPAAENCHPHHHPNLRHNFRQILAGTSHHLTLLEVGEHAEERDLWRWTLTLVGDEVAALPAEDAAQPTLTAAGREATALAAAVATGDALPALRPRVAALREALTKVAVDWSFAAVLGPKAQ